MASERRLAGRPVVPGEARGTALVMEDGLSLAMAFDVATGRITDVHSAQRGVVATGRILVMPSGRGSSSASTSLAEAIRLGTAPAAILMSELDEILAVGAIVAGRLYGRSCPIVVMDDTERRSIPSDAEVRVEADGSVVISG